MRQYVNMEERGVPENWLDSWLKGGMSVPLVSGAIKPLLLSKGLHLYLEKMVKEGDSGAASLLI